ncbi:MAG: homoserine O-acetyltransferase MetX [Nocardioides sp.]
MSEASTDAGVQRAVLFTEDDPLVLATGATLSPVEVAFETWGELNAARSNAVFVAHALTGDSHAANSGGRPGWWNAMVGPSKPVDTERFFVVCPNLLGGCNGTTGPRSINPATGARYDLDFPVVQIEDLVSVHRRLLQHLGIRRLHACIGGSLGGMQALSWALQAPNEIARAVLVAASSQLTAQNMAFSAVGRSVIMNDPGFAGGSYVDGEGPRLGLATARMMAHITYLSDQSMTAKFDRRLQQGVRPRHQLAPEFAVESYLHHQGETFVDRFDALTYLYLSRCLDYFDPFADPEVTVRLAAADTRMSLLSFDSDWRFSTAHSQRIAAHLSVAGVDHDFVEISAPHGHDSFLFDLPEYTAAVRGFLSG